MFSQIITVFFDSYLPDNRIKFAEVIVEILSITKRADSVVMQFWEYVFQNDITLKYTNKNIQIYRSIIKDWLKKPSKTKYLEYALSNDGLKTLLVKHDYQLFTEISNKVKSLGGNES